MNPAPQTQPPASLPDRYPSAWIEPVRLKDGTAVLICPIRPEDAPRLQAGFAHLSARSIYLRFLEPYKQLPDKLARQFAEVDYQTQMALVAEVETTGTVRLVGVARYAFVNGAGKQRAESAIIVGDDFQRRGLGTLLMDRLTRYAVSNGIDAFVATVHHTNGEILNFIKRSGLTTNRRMIEPGVWEIEVDLKSG